MRYCTIILTAISIATSQVRAGQVTIAQPTLSGSPPNQYLAISLYNAMNTGVSFQATDTVQNGSVNAWQWTFTNGTPATVNAASATMVTFSQSAYGQSNACTVGLQHTGSKGENCFPGPTGGGGSNNNAVVAPKENADAAKTSIGPQPDQASGGGTTGVVATVSVNVVQPNLVFNTTGTGTPADTWIGPAERSFNFSQLGTTCEYPDPNSGLLHVGCPYEYIYTIASPVNSGANSSDLAIYEENNFIETYYTNFGDNKSQDVTTETIPSATYNGTTGMCTYPTVPAPSNPTMYAVDVPGLRESDEESIMNQNGWNYYVCQIGLESYPLYQDPQHQHLSGVTPVSHTFTYTCRRTPGTNGNPASFSWSSTAH